MPEFLGRKLKECPIEFHRAVLGDVEMYYVALEEALHSVSVLHPHDGTEWELLRGMEETVVAACLELLKNEMRALFGEPLLPASLHPLYYGKNMKALGTLRRLTDLSGDEVHVLEEFYFDLLKTPLWQRKGRIVQQIARATQVSEEGILNNPDVDRLFSIIAEDTL